MHFCPDEANALALALGSMPVVGYALIKLKHFWHRLWHRGTPKDDGCCDGHEHD